MGKGTFLGEALSLSGIMKIMECVLVFCTLLVHRHANGGKYVFFGTATEALSNVRLSHQCPSHNPDPKKSSFVTYPLGFFFQQNVGLCMPSKIRALNVAYLTDTSIAIGKTDR